MACESDTADRGFGLCCFALLQDKRHNTVGNEKQGQGTDPQHARAVTLSC